MTDDGFIGLPPGMTPPTDSGTVKRDRTDRQREKRDEVVFFPVVPGVPAPRVVHPVEPVPVPAELDGAELDGAELDPAALHAPSWRLDVPGHGAIPVGGVLFIGRNPSTTAAHPDGALLAVNDEARSLSKTHAMLEIDDGALWVHDLESTNGVWVVDPGEEAIEVIPGQRAPVPSGGTIELGDLVIQVDYS